MNRSFFKEDDRVTLSRKTEDWFYNTTAIGAEGTFRGVMGGFATVSWDYGKASGFPDGYHRAHLNDLDLISTKSKETIMSSLAKRVKELTLSSADKALRKQGFTDEQGNRTDEGTQVLLDKLFNDHKSDLVDIAKELEAEEKAAKKA